MKKIMLKFIHRNWFSLLILLFIIFRLVILLYSDKFNYPEECVYGAIADDISNGMHLPLLDYQYDDYSGAYLTNSLILAALLRIFGTNYLIIKLLAFCYSLIAFILSGILLKKFYDSRTTTITMLLLIFCPPFITLFSLTLFAGYTESIILFLLAFYILIIDENKLKNKTKFFLIGVVLGFSVWIYYYGLISTLVIAALIFLSDKKKFLRSDFISFALGLMIGFFPWFLYAFEYNFSSLDRLAITVLTNPFTNLVQKLPDLIYFFPASFFFEFGNLTKIMSYFFGILMLSLIVFFFLTAISLKSKRKSFETAVLLYIILYLAAFLFSNLRIYYTEFNNIWNVRNLVSFSHVYLLFIPLIIACGISISWIIERRKVLGWIIFFLMAGICLVANMSLLNGKNLSEEKFCYETFGRSIGWKYYSSDPAIQYQKCNIIENKSYNIGCFLGIGEKSLLSSNDFQYAARICSQLQGEPQYLCFEGVGNSIATIYLKNTSSICENTPSEAAKIFCIKGTSLEMRMALLGDKNSTSEISSFCISYFNSSYFHYCADPTYMSICKKYPNFNVCN